MVIINEQKYDLDRVETEWGTFTRKYKNQIKTGIAPRINFFLCRDNENIKLTLELTVTREEFKDMEIGIKKDLKEEIADIGFEDDKGWMSLIGNDYTFFITKINNEKFATKFRCNSNYETLNIDMDEVIEIVLPTN